MSSEFVRCLPRIMNGIAWFACNLTLPAGQVQVGSRAMTSKTGLMMYTLTLEGKSVFMFAITMTD